MQLGRMLAIAGKNDEAVAEMEAGRSWIRRTARRSAIWRICMRTRERTIRRRNGLQRAADGDIRMTPNCTVRLGRACCVRRSFQPRSRSLLRTVQLKPDLGDGVRGTGLRRQREQGLCAGDKGDGRAGEVPAGSAARYFMRATAYDHLQGREAGVEVLSFVSGYGGREVSGSGVAGEAPADRAGAEEVSRA